MQMNFVISTFVYIFVTSIFVGRDISGFNPKSVLCTQFCPGNANSDINQKNTKSSVNLRVQQ